MDLVCFGWVLFDFSLGCRIVTNFKRGNFGQYGIRFLSAHITWVQFHCVSKYSESSKWSLKPKFIRIQAVLVKLSSCCFYTCLKLYIKDALLCLRYQKMWDDISYLQGYRGARNRFVYYHHYTHHIHLMFCKCWRNCKVSCNMILFTHQPIQTCSIYLCVWTASLL